MQVVLRETACVDEIVALVEFGASSSGCVPLDGSAPLVLAAEVQFTGEVLLLPPTSPADDVVAGLADAEGEHVCTFTVNGDSGGCLVV